MVGERLELVPVAMVAGGDALSRGGQVVFVRGALPGERVLVEMIERRKDFARARVVGLIEASPHRRAPTCPHTTCGGCTWQYIERVHQLELKRRIVDDSLRRIGRLAAPMVTAGAAVTAGRTTARLGVDRYGRLGFRRHRSHELAIVEACEVSHPRLAELIPLVRGRGAKEVTLRVSDHSGERVAAVHGGHADLPDDVQLNGSITEMVRDVPLQVSIDSFFQASPNAAALLVDAVAHAAGEQFLNASHIVDAYAGVGLFPATLATATSHWTVIESNGSAAADARHNLAHLDATVMAMDVAEAKFASADLVIADPSRTGLERPGVKALAGAHRIVLVSCDAAALGRDAALLVAAGYSHRGSVVLDLFPNTFHVEVVTVFDSSESDPATYSKRA